MKHVHRIDDRHGRMERESWRPSDQPVDASDGVPPRGIPDSFQQDPKPAWNPAKRYMGEPLNLRWIQGWSISGKSCYLGFQMNLM